jgi:dCTP deaminase
MILNDAQITNLVKTKNLIEPFSNSLIREISTDSHNIKVISYGISSFGYDIRLSDHEFRIFKPEFATTNKSIIDPKNFNYDYLQIAKLHEDKNGNYFVIPANSYGLGVAVERLNIPNYITVIALGKSTYARCGIIANITPAEAGWKGYLTLEFSNSSNVDCKIYANEGVVQLLFLPGEHCNVSYDDRIGKYQDQQQHITLPIV